MPKKKNPTEYDLVLWEPGRPPPPEVDNLPALGAWLNHELDQFAYHAKHTSTDFSQYNAMICDSARLSVAVVLRRVGELRAGIKVPALPTLPGDPLLALEVLRNWCTSAASTKTPATWTPPDGYVGVKTIGADLRFRKGEKNPPRTTIDVWIKADNPKVVKDPATQEVHVPMDWIVDRISRWTPRT